jgi:hypothetical protein
VPQNVELEFVLSRSPQLQPAKRLWPLGLPRAGDQPPLRKARYQLEDALVDCCLTLSRQPEFIRSQLGYRW